MTIELAVPRNFNFWRTVFSHGWCALQPFRVDKQNNNLKRLLNLTDGRMLVAEIEQKFKYKLTISTATKLTNEQKKEILCRIAACFRLEEDYSEFYASAQKHQEFRWIPKTGAGRLLRAPTVFEDAVKMICTTNCSWALTEIMVNNLCGKLGVKFSDDLSSFPKPETIADVSEKFLRREIRTGYRSPYLLELSKRIVKSDINLELWRTSTIPTRELYGEVLSIKGMGPYAAGNMLKLLGRYDYLGIDSWCRKRFFEIHRGGRKASDKTIENHYARYGKWRGLFFWMDVTKHWYNQKFPF